MERLATFYCETLKLLYLPFSAQLVLLRPPCLLIWLKTLETRTKKERFNQRKILQCNEDAKIYKVKNIYNSDVMVELETGLIPFTIKHNLLFPFLVFLLFIKLTVFYIFHELKKVNWCSINSHWLIIKGKEKIRRHTSSLLLQICMNSVIH